MEVAVRTDRAEAILEWLGRLDAWADTTGSLTLPDTDEVRELLDADAADTVLAACRGDVDRMGALHGVQPTIAAAALALAAKLDATPSEGAARELRMMMRELWQLQHFGVKDEAPKRAGEQQQQDEPPPAPVDPVDELAARRQERIGPG
jgi:hypothetical protein